MGSGSGTPEKALLFSGEQYMTGLQSGMER